MYEWKVDEKCKKLSRKWFKLKAENPWRFLWEGGQSKPSYHGIKTVGCGSWGGFCSAMIKRAI